MHLASAHNARQLRDKEAPLSYLARTHTGPYPPPAQRGADGLGQHPHPARGHLRRRAPHVRVRPLPAPAAPQPPAPAGAQRGAGVAAAAQGCVRTRARAHRCMCMRRVYEACAPPPCGVPTRGDACHHQVRGPSSFLAL